MTIPPPADVRRIVYLGTPALAVPPLVALAGADFEIPLVVSGPDKRRGRGGATTPSPVKRAALDLGLTVTSDLDDLGDTGADLGVVVAFGRLIPASVLDRLAVVNLHFSLLPRWRGAAPVERAVLAGDETTGVCLMAVEETLDTGPVYVREVVPIGPDETVSELRDRLVEVGTRQLVAALSHGLGSPEPQVGAPVYAPKLDPRELELDWTDAAEHLDRVVRVGGAWTTFRGRRLKVNRSAVVEDGPIGSGDGVATSPGTIVGPAVVTGRGMLELIEVQPEGRRAQAGSDWLNGAQPRTDERLGGGDGAARR